ncbi:V-set and immunoglobulin domain-containing protein 10-like 2 [Apteryx mantelli]|uniref:V-set and immunoglobulin domain-containing protein 10-like 2 n=1 Tax=Apteryx mantelli TaxID=2696672 RepID=UPI00351BC72B
MERGWALPLLLCWRGRWILWLLPALAGGDAPTVSVPGAYEERTVTGVRGRAVELGCGPPGAAVVFWSFAGPPGAPEPPRAVAVAAGGRAALAPGAGALGRPSVRNGTLRLGRLRPAAQGRFLCQALRPERGRLRAAYAAVRLRVLVPVSKPAVRPAAAAVAEGAAAALRCAVREGSAPLRFSWRRHHPAEGHRGDDDDGDDDGGDDGATAGRGAALRLAPAARSHAGWYACTARNEVSSRSSAPAFLDVAYGPDAPVITAGGGEAQRALAAAEGAALVLRCRAASRPRCRYAWLRDGGRLQRGATLRLPRLAAAHAGTYACLARNPRLRTRARAALRLTVRPRPPVASYVAAPVAAVAGMALAAAAALLAARHVAHNRDQHPRLHALLFRT